MVILDDEDYGEDDDDGGDYDGSHASLTVVLEWMQLLPYCQPPSSEKKSAQFREEPFKLSFKLMRWDWDYVRWVRKFARRRTWIWEQLVVQSWSIPKKGVEFEFLEVGTVYYF